MHPNNLWLQRLGYEETHRSSRPQTLKCHSSKSELVFKLEQSPRLPQGNHLEAHNSHYLFYYNDINTHIKPIVSPGSNAVSLKCNASSCQSN